MDQTSEWQCDCILPEDIRLSDQQMTDVAPVLGIGTDLLCTQGTGSDGELTVQSTPCTTLHTQTHTHAPTECLPSLTMYR